MASDVVKFKKKKQLNIGIIMFGIIFIYLLATVVMYLIAPNVTVYEVRRGSILKDTAFTGLAIRDEIVVTADHGGYINYYAQNCSKVKVGENVYTLSSQKLSFDDNTASNSTPLTSEQQHAIGLRIQQFVYDYTDSYFSDSYILKSDLTASLNGIHNQSKFEQLNNMISQGVISDVDIYQTIDDGIVVYTVDGMEHLTVDSVTETHLDKSNYKKTEYSNNTKIKSGDAVYKIVTDDEWTLLLDLDEETANTLKDKNRVKVNFTKDNQTMVARLRIENQKNHHFAYLTFDNAMIRYASERYLDVKLILEDETGLKIPKSAKVKKDFYIVPTEFITRGGNSNDQGVVKEFTDENGQKQFGFVSAEIYYKDEDAGISYLNTEGFQDGDIIYKEATTETYTLKQKKKLDGVYCINRGYAAFRVIDILCESDTYYIVKEGISYGLSNYDHIALDGNSTKEEDIVF